jgi:two-component system phosphate regulon response regulator PhoB
MSCYLDQSRRELVGNHGRKQLGRIEYRILQRLVEAEGQPVSKDDLIEAAYPPDVVYAGVTDESLAQIIARLRRKSKQISPIGAHLIKSVHGIGYTWQVGEEGAAH